MGFFEVEFVLIEMIAKIFVVIDISFSGRGEFGELIVFVPIRNSQLKFFEPDGFDEIVTRTIVKCLTKSIYIAHATDHYYGDSKFLCSYGTDHFVATQLL